MLHSLQACRAVAAILVVLFHASGSIFALPKYFGHKPYGAVFDFGFAGVDFFFVLSGFIMMHVHADDVGNPRALAGYLWKRFSRIYPVYWVVLAAIVPVYLLVPRFGNGYEVEPEVLFRSVLLIPHPDTHLTLSVAWTLVYEVVFYALFAILIVNRRVGVWMFAVWTAGLFVQPFFQGSLHPFLFNNLNLRFLAGVGVALFVARWQVPWPRVVGAAGAAIFTGTGLYVAYDGPLSPWTQAAGFTIGSALTLCGLVQAERSECVAPPRWLVYLGDASYSIYLVHFPALSALAKLAKVCNADAYVSSPILFWLHVAGAIGIGCAFHHLIEYPIHRWAKGAFRRHTRPSSAADPPARLAA